MHTIINLTQSFSRYNVVDTSHPQDLLGQAHNQTSHCGATRGTEKLALRRLFELHDGGISDQLLIFRFEVVMDIVLCQRGLQRFDFIS